jgi:glycosyltransferase involved in cell wall biosynthesis
MKILIVTPFFAPFSGVGSSRMISLVKYIEKNTNISVDIVRNNPKTYPSEYVKTNLDFKSDIYDVDVTGDFIVNSQLYSNVIEKLNNENSYNLILLSVGPYYTLNGLNTLLNTKSIKTPFIIDYRDLWTFETYRYDNLFSDLKRQILRMKFRKTEKDILKKASSIITVTKADRFRMIKKASLEQIKVALIFNGYETPDFEVYRKRKFERENNIHFGIFGKFGYYNHKLANKFIKSVKKIQTDGINVKITHVGIPEVCIEDMIKKHKLRVSTYYNTGAKSYHEGIEYLMQTDINIIVYSSKTGLGTKIYDYIMLDKPILAIVSKKSDLAKLVTTFKHGYATTKTREIYNYILYIANNKIDNLDNMNTESYSRLEQNKRFIELFNNFQKEQKDEKAITS